MIGGALLRRFARPLILLAALGVIALIGDADALFEARVRRIVDGDTLVVVDGDDAVRTIRLWGVDAPELTQPHGTRARDALAALLSEGAVRVHIEDTDSFGREVAVLRTPAGEHVNHALVWQGHAWHYRRYAPFELRLWIGQAYARLRDRGLWAMGGSPTPPWEWR